MSPSESKAGLRLLRTVPRAAATLIVLGLAGLAGWQLWDYYMNEPWTRDARVRANVVVIAPDVAGLVTGVPVEDNGEVRRGDVLFTIDQSRYTLDVQATQAALEAAQAAMEKAQSDAARLAKLSRDAVSEQQQQNSALEAARAAALVRQAEADLQLAQVNLSRTTVLAPVNGYIVDLQLRVGDYATVGSPAIALVDSDSYYVDGYFEETKLRRIKVGDAVEIRLMGSREVVPGRVQGLARGIVDRERGTTFQLLPNVNPTFSWVRLPQRIPVRITLEGAPSDIPLVAGLTATVTVKEEAR